MFTSLADNGSFEFCRRWAILSVIILFGAPTAAWGEPLVKDLGKYLANAEQGPRRKEDGVLLMPSQGFPSVVARGDDFQLYLARTAATVCSGGESVKLMGRLPSYECQDVAAQCTPHQYSVRVLSRGRKGGFPWIRVSVPLKVPADTYDLSISCGGQQVGERRRAVRVLAEPPTGKLRIAVVADPQLGDPLIDSKDCNGPFRRRHAEQTLEINLRHLDALDPDLVLLPGDLSFGSDYSIEVPYNMDFFAGASFAIHYVPGNHDLYTTYELECAQDATPPLSLLLQILGTDQEYAHRPTPREAWREAKMLASCLASVALKMDKTVAVRCGRAPSLGAFRDLFRSITSDSVLAGFRSLLSRQGTGRLKAQFKVAVGRILQTFLLEAVRWLTCVRKEGADTIFQSSIKVANGLDYWHGWVGPTDYAFELGGYRFVALNSMTGSAQRRGTFVLRMLDAYHRGQLAKKSLSQNESIVDQLLRAEIPAASNYGGRLEKDQLTWLAQLSWSQDGGTPLVVFMHHDPRGNPKNTPSPYEPEQTFPVGCTEVPHEQFNPLEEWSIDVAGGEKPENNSGRKVLKIIGQQSSSSLVLGHAHRQETTGVNGITLLRAPTVSSSCGNKDTGCNCRGFRMLEGTGGALKPGTEEGGQGIVRTGWLRVTGGMASRKLKNRGPVMVKARQRLTLPAHPAGYDFSPGKLRDVGFDQAMVPKVFYVEVLVPSGGQVSLKPIKRVPKDRWAPIIQDGTGERPPERLSTGESITLTCSESVVAQIWNVDGVEVHRGENFTWTADQPGTHYLSVNMVDSFGRMAELRIIIEVGRIRPEYLIAAAAGGVAFILSGVGYWWFRRRRRAGR